MDINIESHDALAGAGIDVWMVQNVNLKVEYSSSEHGNKEIRAPIVSSIEMKSFHDYREDP